MSYCRWSSDAGRCDVHVYEDILRGWITHVAGRKLKAEPPPECIVPPGADVTAIIKAHTAYSSWIKAVTTTSKGEIDDNAYTPLLLPHAGKSFNHSTPGECAAWLEELRQLGYRVPQYAIDALQEDQAEMDAKEPKQPKQLELNLTYTE